VPREVRDCNCSMFCVCTRPFRECAFHGLRNTLCNESACSHSCHNGAQRPPNKPTAAPRAMNDHLDIDVPPCLRQELGSLLGRLETYLAQRVAKRWRIEKEPPHQTVQMLQPDSSHAHVL
jgi:hypothetical protein